jgi:threonine/homoserine/homoserine lactone efflux protein
MSFEIWLPFVAASMLLLVIAGPTILLAISYGLGFKLWRAGGTLDAKPLTNRTSVLRMVGHAWIVTALNPKSITFCVAFLPQFLNKSGDFWTQMLIFQATFLTLAFVNAVGYGLVASRARVGWRKTPVQCAWSTGLGATC